jgi:protein SCO1/2
MVLAAALVMLTLVVGITLFASRGAGVDDRRYRGSEPPPGIALPAFRLPSYTGNEVSSRSLEGLVVLLTVLDSQCTEACPVLATVTARALDRLAPAERAQVRALALTADPEEDTPRSVRRFLSSQRAEGRLDYLLGTESELRPLWKALSVLPSLDTGRDSVHSAPLRIYDRDGVWVATLHAGADLSEPNLIHDIRVALAEG